MYGKATCSEALGTFKADSTVGRKNEDYVYLALINNGQIPTDPLPEAASRCHLSPSRCFERVQGGTSVGTGSRPQRKLFLISGAINLALLLLILPLGATTTYLLVTRSRYSGSKLQEKDVSAGNVSCMVPRLCSDALWEQFQDHFYWFSWHHVTWAQARSQCRHLGADLVSIHSRKENDFLVRKILTRFRPGSRAAGYYFWIGLMRDITTSDQRLVWVDGSSVSFQLWSEHQPDNEGGLEHCGQSSLSPGNRGHWADRRCWTQQPFVCKRLITQHPP